ncbi:MAG: nitrous oxide-stimulated promoter family protein [Bacteroidetes bacterium]|nr:nitrous oxide-stimulated promoter family protein [Bacteroidota bacterium]
MKTPDISRLDRERKTIRVMIALWCRGNHNRDLTECPDCTALFTYALNRISRCPFAGNKPTCAQCTVHCYRSDPREQIRKVMRYSGPRMLIYHPILTVRHYWDEWSHARTST